MTTTPPPRDGDNQPVVPPENPGTIKLTPEVTPVADISAVFGGDGGPTDPTASRQPTDATAATAGGAWTAEELSAPQQRYELRGQLGRGGMGVVHAAFDRALRREVAYKLMHGKRVDAEALARFVHEAQVTSQLEHPNIIPVHELGRTDAGEPYFTMKKVRGTTLKDRLRDARDALNRGGDPWAVFPLGERIDVLRKVLDAMGIAHELGVIHRDLKPENIMVGRHGEVLVMDWGLARLIGSDPDSGSVVIATDRDESGSHRTQSGTVAGTPAYMSPEQARGEIELMDQRSDLFAVGALLYEMLTLAPPYDGAANLVVVAKAAKADFEPVTVRAHKTMGRHAYRIPKDLAAIAEKAMSADPADRYEWAATMRLDLDAWAESRPTTARRANPLESAARWTRRNPTTAITGSLALVFVLVFAALIGRLQLADNQAELASARAESERRDRERSDALAQAAESARDAAEARAAREEADRIAAEAKAASEEADRIAAEAKAAEQEAVLRAQSIGRRDAAVERFVQLYAAKEAKGQSDDEFAAELGEDRLQLFLAALDRLIDEVAPLTGLELDAADYFYRGLIHDTMGDFAAAIADYSEAIRIDPELASVYNNRGNAEASLGNHDAAIADYSEAIRIDPGDATAYNNRASSQDSLGNYEAAIADYSQAIRVDPDFAIAYKNRGTARYSHGEYEAAIADYSEAIRVNPEYTLAYNQRGIAHESLGNYEAAIADYSEAIRTDPGYAMAHNNRGLAQESLGNHEAAIKDYTEAIRIDPGYVEAHVSRGSSQHSLGNYEAAIADYAEAIRIDPECAMAYYNRGLTQYSYGNYEAAIADYSEAIRLLPEDHPEYAAAHINRGNAHQSFGNHGAAIADYSKAIRIDPNHHGAYFNRGRSQQVLGNHDAAIADYSEAIRINPEPAVGYHSQRGHAHALLGNLDAAVADFSEVIRLDPQNAWAYNNRGLAQESLGKHDAAFADYAEAIRHNPDYALAYFNRGNAHTWHRNYDAAIADYSEAIRINPEFVDAYFNRGIAQASLGKYELAIEDYSGAIRVNPGFAFAYTNRGNCQEALGNYDAAITDFSEAIRINPTGWSGWANRGRVRVGREIDVPAGIADLQQGYRLCPSPSVREQIAAAIRQFGGEVPTADGVPQTAPADGE
jgi:tetratricopeptide (TPR) repeat protein/tRNA A-37 threonylcarbamoyl transferase component Bud32